MCYQLLAIIRFQESRLLIVIRRKSAAKMLKNNYRKLCSSDIQMAHRYFFKNLYLSEKYKIENCSNFCATHTKEFEHISHFSRHLFLYKSTN